MFIFASLYQRVMYKSSKINCFCLFFNCTHVDSVIQLLYYDIWEKMVMAIGERIRFIRKLRKLTQTQLGIKVGFPENTAEVRMTQYETGTRTPKENLTKVIAELLDVSSLALKVPDIDSNLGLMHTFFAIEDIYGLEVKTEDDKLVFRFKDEKQLDPSLHQMFFEWAKQAQKLENGEITKEDYDKWRYNYPKYDDTQIFEEVPSQGLSDLITNELK